MLIDIDELNVILLETVVYQFIAHSLTEIGRVDEEHFQFIFINTGKADNFAGFPKTVIVTAEYDPLRDDGEAFYRQLKESGCDASLIRADGMMHGFMLYWHRLDKAEEIISSIKELI